MPKGENNPQAQLSDAEVELLRSLYEADKRLPRAERMWTGHALADKFEITVRHVWYILSYQRR
jgi:hypothetical protein